MSCIWIFIHFMKFGILCFGGGYMLLPLLIAEFVGNDKVITEVIFANLISIAQLTPGPVGINAATFIGFLENGVRGALAATLGLVFPTLILAGLAVTLISKWQKTKFIQGLLAGARMAALALICYAVTIFVRLSILSEKSGGEISISLWGTVIALTSFFLFLKTKISSTWVIIGSGIVGAFLLR